ncbi:MAG: dockerin type I domain-containing protein, partial [Muribaculaceae bacterium]|nr:dockerin type I domain-containing protein [Muribaculaceae bacterium]
MKKLLLLIAMLCCLQANAAVRGDVNGDNNVDVSDINIVINEILGKGGTYNADVNGDGTTDVSDINIVINIILGKDTPEDDHEYVDLGLPGGVLWASWNIGASKAEDYGLYFAWGETKGYAKGESHSFDWNNYSYKEDRDLDAAHDAATANWGAGWRMPTLQEIKDLYNRNYTTTEWVTVNGVNGRKIT